MTAKQIPLSPNLLPLERETIVIFNESEKEACVYSTNPFITKRLKGFAEEFETITLIKEDEYGADFIMPKSLISFRKPTVLTDDRKKALTEKMAKINLLRTQRIQDAKDPT